MRKRDWTLVLAWFFYVTLVGPFLLSARDWLLVFAAFAACGGLVYWTVRVIKHHMRGRSDA